MSQFSPYQRPGMRPISGSDERTVTWRGRFGQDQSATRTIVIDASARDAGSATTTTLRAGLVMAIATADGRAYPYDPAANDGRQNPIGVLESAVDLLEQGVAVDRFAPILVAGLLRESGLIGLDPRARQILSRRFVFDKDGVSSGAVAAPKGVARRQGNVTLTAADQGTQFIAAAAATFTLPAKQNGLSFRFAQTADAALTLVGSGDLVVPGNAAASNVSCNTANQRIGSQLLVECVYVSDTAMKWLVTNVGGTTLTVS